RVLTTDLAELGFLRVGPDGAKVLAGNASYGQTGRPAAAVHDADTRRKRADWHGFHVGLADLDGSPDGTRAVAALTSTVTLAYTDRQKPERQTFTERVAYVWDATTGRDLAHLRGHTDKVVACRFSPDGT